MIRYDIDGILVWLSEQDEKEGKPALILEQPTYSRGDHYMVKLMLPDRSSVMEKTHTTLREALMHFIEKLPEST